MALLGYREALIYLVALAAIDGAFFLYAALYRPELAGFFAVRSLLVLVVVLGLWVTSNFVRYAGAILLLTIFAAVLWSFITAKTEAYGVIGTWVMTGQSMILFFSFSMLFSKTFSKEFYAERESQPGYKRALRTAIVATILLAITAATLYDVYNLIAS